MRATAERFDVQPVVAAVYEEEGFRAALDCDVLFSCVDRQWGRHVLNLIAYAHLVPVIDGGISVRSNRKGELAAADWRAHTVTVGHRCMQCLGQYNSGLVQLERDGYLDDPTYIEDLKKDHPLRMRENVFAFSMGCASLQMLQMLALVIDPLGQSNPGEQRYHFVGGYMEPPEFGSCHPECLFPGGRRPRRSLRLQRNGQTTAAVALCARSGHSSPVHPSYSVYRCLKRVRVYSRLDQRTEGVRRRICAIEVVTSLTDYLKRK